MEEFSDKKNSAEPWGAKVAGVPAVCCRICESITEQITELVGKNI